MPENMSFLPEDYLARRMARRTNIICLTLFVIVGAGLVATYFVDQAQRLGVHERLAAVKQEKQEAAERLKQLEELQARKQEWTRKAQVASVLIERLPRTLVLSELVNHMPQTLSLLDLQLKTEVSKVTPPPASRVQAERAKNARRSRKADAGKGGEGVIEAPKLKVSMDLTGVAPTDVEIAEYITALSAHPMFTEVSLKFSEQSKVEDRDMRKFGLMLVLNGDMDLRQIEPLKVARGLKMDPMGGKVELTPNPMVPVTPASDMD